MCIRDRPVAEGLVPFRDIRDQIGRLTVLPHALVSDATGERLAMGDRVIVQLTQVDDKLGHVEFALVARQSGQRKSRRDQPLDRSGGSGRSSGRPVGTKAGRSLKRKQRQRIERQVAPQIQMDNEEPTSQTQGLESEAVNPPEKTKRRRATAKSMKKSPRRTEKPKKARLARRAQSSQSEASRRASSAPSAVDSESDARTSSLESDKKPYRRRAKK